MVNTLEVRGSCLQSPFFLSLERETRAESLNIWYRTRTNKDGQMYHCNINVRGFVKCSSFTAKSMKLTPSFVHKTAQQTHSLTANGEIYQIPEVFVRWWNTIRSPIPLHHSNEGGCFPEWSYNTLY